MTGPASRIALTVAALLLLAACGEATQTRATPLRGNARPSAIVPTTTGPTTTPVESIPDDPDVATCQTVVNESVTEWTFDEGTPVRCAPASDELFESRGPQGQQSIGRFTGGVAYVAAPLPVNEPAPYYRSTAAHELGHAWDAHHLTDTQRARYMAIRGYKGEWSNSNAAEDYADVFALLLSGLGEQTPTAYIGQAGRAGAIGTRPTPDQITTICTQHLVPGC